MAIRSGNGRTWGSFANEKRWGERLSKVKYYSFDEVLKHKKTHASDKVAQMSFSRAQLWARHYDIQHRCLLVSQRRLRLKSQAQTTRARETERYFSSTVAPAPSSCAFAFSASSLDTFSKTGLGAASTRSLASLSPRLVSARTSLIT